MSTTLVWHVSHISISIPSLFHILWLLAAHLLANHPIVTWLIFRNGDQCWIACRSWCSCGSSRSRPVDTSDVWVPLLLIPCPNSSVFFLKKGGTGKNKIWDVERRWDKEIIGASSHAHYSHFLTTLTAIIQSVFIYGLCIRLPYTSIPYWLMSVTKCQKIKEKSISPTISTHPKFSTLRPWWTGTAIAPKPSSSSSRIGHHQASLRWSEFRNRKSEWYIINN